MGANRHIDTMGPKKELEKAERQLELIKRETQKSFEREKRQLEKKIDSRRVSMAPMPADMAARSRRVSTATTASIATTAQDFESPAAKGSAVDSLRTPKLSSFSKDLMPEIGLHHQLTPAERQADALRQLRYLHDMVLSMIKEAQIQVSVHETSGSEARRARMSVVSWRSEAVDDEAKSSQVSRRASSTGDETRRRRMSRSFTVDGNDSVDAQYFQSGTSTPMTDEFLTPPCPAVELITMARMLCMGRNLDTKQIKALTAVLEECRFAVKAIKGGMESDRAQERLIKRLNELMDLVRPLGGDLLISPAEILRCSYLRLSPENIETMEQMMIDQGLSPGIHCHTKVENMTLQELRELDAKMPPGSAKLTPLPRSIQPVTIFQTKAGTPMDKRRVSRPDGGMGFIEEEAAPKRERKKTVTM